MNHASGQRKLGKSTLSLGRLSRCMMRVMVSPRKEYGSLYIQVFVDSILALIHTARSDGCPDYFNKPWLEYFGVNMDRASGLNWTAFVHPQDVDGIVAKWQAYLATGKIFEHETCVRRAKGDSRRRNCQFAITTASSSNGMDRTSMSRKEKEKRRKKCSAEKPRSCKEANCRLNCSQESSFEPMEGAQ
jgi:PAS domain-containing protein